ncbi:hypothetical protein [Colwellia sp. MEBiC06753]
MSDSTVELVKLAMNIAQKEQYIATQNIALANVKGQHASRVDFSNLLDSLASMEQGDRAESVSQNLNDWHLVSERAIYSSIAHVELDKEVAYSLMAAGKYKTLADSVSRKLGLMQTAIGKK